MAEIRVTPHGNLWMVKKNGGVVSNHRKKKPAVRSARSKAKPGDQLIIHDSQGRVSKSVTVQ